MSLLESFRGRRVLVTGHTGFKGSWLSLWLTKLGARVAGYALQPPTSPILFELLRLERDVDHTVGDVRDFAALAAAFARVKPEVVFHLAAQPLVRRSYREPRETFDTNVGGTVNVLEAIRQTSSVEAAVIVTSDKCYENREWLLGYRESDPMGGHDPYSASKGAAELVVAAYRSSFFAPGASGRPVAVASARAGNVIGGGDFAEDRIIPDAVRAIESEQPLEVRNPGSTRPWQHVLDPLGGYLTLAGRLLREPEGASEAFNFGPELSGVATVRALVDRFHAEMGCGRLRDVSKRQRNAPHEARLLRLSCDKAHHVLGWRPVFTTDEAITHTAAWYRQVLLEGKRAAVACREDILAYERGARDQGGAGATKAGPRRRGAHNPGSGGKKARRR